MIARLIRDRWLFVPLVLLTACIAWVVLTTTLAIAGHPLGVEPEYDLKAAQFQATRDQWQVNDSLRWVITPVLTPMVGDVVELRLRVEDKHGIAIDRAAVRVECVPIANADLRTALDLAPGTPGDYSVVFRPARGGLHELRIEVSRDGQRYTDTVRRRIPGGSVE